MYVASWCSACFCVVLFVGFCTGHFVKVPLNLTYQHCLQHSFFEHLFNLYLFKRQCIKINYQNIFILIGVYVGCAEVCHCFNICQLVSIRLCLK